MSINRRLPVLVAKKYQEKIEENRRSQKERRTNPKNLKEKLEKPVKTERGISGLMVYVYRLLLPFWFIFLDFLDFLFLFVLFNLFLPPITRIGIEERRGFFGETGSDIEDRRTRGGIRGRFGDGGTVARRIEELIKVCVIKSVSVCVICISSLFRKI